MTRTLCAANLLGQADRLSIPSIRFALRLALASKCNCADVINADERLFELVGPVLIWSAQDMDELWKRFDLASKTSQASENRGPLEFCELLLANERKLWTVYRDFASDRWQRDPKEIQRVFSETLAALECEVTLALGRHPNLTHAAELYELDATEVSILECALTAHQWPSFREFLRCFPMPSTDSVWTGFAAMVQCSEVRLRDLLDTKGRLSISRLIGLDIAPEHLHEFLKLGPVATGLFSRGKTSKQGLVAEFLEPVGGPQLGLNDFAHLTTEIEWVVQCLQAAVHKREHGVNILIMGPTGCGKSELARVLIAKSGIPGLEITADMGNLGPDTDLELRLERLGWAQRLLQTCPPAVLLFDELGDAVKNCIGQLKEKLDETRLPTIWIADGIEALSDSVLRRFAFHIDLGQASIATRKHIAATLTGDFGIETDRLDGIASDPAISPAQIQMAVRFAKLVGGGDAPARADVLLSALEAGQRIKGGVALSQMHSANTTGWDIDALNLEASAPLPRILAALHRTGSASMAFYGTPGTGKTSLATHIAQSLNKPLICKRVSDLSSRWLGETEKCIANMFREATAENAVLLLDEGDSFLRDRRLARASWEVTQVNELLQQMESFKGVFICATNLMDDIDSAALRRFTFKVKFLPLDDLRRRRMLARFALLNADADLPRPICDRLSALSELAPGDFATVRRQEVLIDERFSLEAWITELEREHALRNPTLKKRVGFV